MQRITEIPRLKVRNKDAHKGTFGRIAIVGGSIGMSGAPALAGQAALRSGAGLGEPLPVDWLEGVPVSTRVTSPREDDAALIAPLAGET